MYESNQVVFGVYRITPLCFCLTSERIMVFGLGSKMEQEFTARLYPSELKA